MTDSYESSKNPLLRLPPHPPTFTPCDHKMIATDKPGIMRCIYCPYEIEITQWEPKG